MQNQTYSIIENYISTVNDLDRLSTTQIINNCFVSKSQITRYVKSKGFSSFSELKYNLITIKKLNSFNTEIDKEIALLKYQLLDVCDKDIALLKQIMHSDKLNLFLTDEYLLLGGVFITNFLKINANINLITKNFELDADTPLLCFGSLPKNYHSKIDQAILVQYRNDGNIENNEVYNIILNPNNNNNNVHDLNKIGIILLMHLISSTDEKNNSHSS